MGCHEQAEHWKQRAEQLKVDCENYQEAYAQLRQVIRDKLENGMLLANNSPGSILRSLERQAWKILKDRKLPDA